MTSAGGSSSPALRQEPTSSEWHATYYFAGRAEPVVVIKFVRGEPLIVRQDGSMFVAPLHRVRLTTRDLP